MDSAWHHKGLAIYATIWMLMGPSGSTRCAEDLALSLRYLEDLGLPVVEEGQTIRITFLGKGTDSRDSIL